MKATGGAIGHMGKKASGQTLTKTLNHCESIVMKKPKLDKSVALQRRKERNKESARVSRNRQKQLYADVVNELREARAKIQELQVKVWAYESATWLNGVLLQDSSLVVQVPCIVTPSPSLQHGIKDSEESEPSFSQLQGEESICGFLESAK